VVSCFDSIVIYLDQSFQIFSCHAQNEQQQAGEHPAKPELPPCYFECLHNGTSYPACTARGTYIEGEATAQCKTCHHYLVTLVEKTEAATGSGADLVCPLCHSVIHHGTGVMMMKEEK